MTPFERIDRDSSSMRPSSMCVRGWNLLGRSRSMSISRARSDAAGGAAGTSGMSALSPRPSAGRLSAMLGLLRRRGRITARQHFAGEREIRLGAARLDVIENRRHAVARRFAKPDIARNDGGVDAILEER